RQNFTCILDRSISLGARRIGPVRVGVVVIKIVAHLFDDMPWHLRTTRPIKISDGVAVMDALERRKVLPDFVNWSNLCLCLTESDCGHSAHDTKNCNSAYLCVLCASAVTAFTYLFTAETRGRRDTQRRLQVGEYSIYISFFSRPR